MSDVSATASSFGVRPGARPGVRSRLQRLLHDPLRQMDYHRNDCFHVIGASLARAGRAGDFCEYGCGVARLDNTTDERARLERARGRSVHGLRLLNVGCGTGGFNVVAADAGAEMVRVLTPGGRVYVHTPNRWSCEEGHYKMFWLPGLPQSLARVYLGLRRRPTAFLGTLRPLTPRTCRNLLENAGARVVAWLGEDAPPRIAGPMAAFVRIYYRTFGIRPYVEVLAERPA